MDSKSGARNLVAGEAGAQRVDDGDPAAHCGLEEEVDPRLLRPLGLYWNTQIVNHHSEKLT